MIVAGSWMPAAAQQSNDEWKVLVEPYLMGAAMNGTTTIRGRQVDIDASASDIFSNLQFGAMGLVVATKGKWGFGTDVIWMSLGTTVRETNVDFDQGAFSFYGLRRLAPAADATFGLRVNTLRGQLTFKTIGLEGKDDQTWVDPVTGLRLRTPADRLLQLRLYSEIGGFGAGSDFTWHLFPSVAINFTDGFSLNLGYRWLDIDYSTGEDNELGKVKAVFEEEK